MSDYIPFYFTPFSPMAYKIKTGHGLRAIPSRDIAILVASLRHLAKEGVEIVFTDRHALLETAQFFKSLDCLTEIDWRALRNRDFRYDVGDPEKVEKYQAEALVEGHLPVKGLRSVVCYGKEQKERLEKWADKAGVTVQIRVNPGMYF